MNLLALDLSLTAIGWATYRPTFPIGCAVYKPAKDGAARLQDAVTWLDTMYDAFRPQFTIIEGYAFGRINQAHRLGELGGVIRLRLHQRHAIVVELPPACRAKLATGKGNAGKEQVLAEAIRRLGYEGHSNDAADARWLLEAALQRYQLPGRAELPKAHLDALTKIEWPPAPLARAS